MANIHLALPEGYTYLKENVADELLVKLRIAEVRDEAGAKAWLQKLETVSYVTWRVKRTYPNSGRVNLFKIDMRCQHNTDNRAKRNKRTHKHTGCPASLCLTVKRNGTDSRSTKAAQNYAYPAIVMIDHCHNHAINVAAALKFRDMGPETKQTLLDLFRHGHSASSAFHCLKTELMLTRSDDYFRVVADGRFVPSVSQIQKLYDKEYRRECSTVSGEDMFTELDRVLQKYCDKGNYGTAKLGRFNDHYFVAICSPLMAVAHQKLTQAAEVVMVEAAEGMYRQKHKVYFFVSLTAAGGIPLGVIVSSSDQQCVFEAAVCCLKTCFPENSFYGKKCPKFFLTDIALKERQVLEQQFPGSLLLLCAFRVLKTVWSWLKDESHSISDFSDRQDLYFRFKSLVYAADVDTLELLHSRIVSSSAYSKYPKFHGYLDSLWNLRTDWALCYRKKLPACGSSVSNYAEIVFRVLKDKIFERMRMFSLAQLVDFILKRYEAYLVRRLFDFCNGRYTKGPIRNILPVASSVSSYDVIELSPEVGLFTVKGQSSAAPGEAYTVDVVRGFCSCSLGSSGKLCEHTSAVLLLLDMRIGSAYKIASTSTKSQLLEVALGSVDPADRLAHLNDRSSQSVSQPSIILPCTLSDSNGSFDLPLKSSAVQVGDIPVQRMVEEQGQADQGTNIPVQLTVEEQGQLQELFERIQAGLVTDPTAFVPAVRKMLQNSKRYASTEKDLIATIRTFGEHSGTPADTRFDCIKRIKFSYDSA